MEDDIDLLQRVDCLYRAFQTKNYLPSVKVKGAGDCYKCRYDPINNQHCPRYTPITMTYQIPCYGRFIDYNN